MIYPDVVAHTLNILFLDCDYQSIFLFNLVITKLSITKMGLILAVDRGILDAK